MKTHLAPFTFLIHVPALENTQPFKGFGDFLMYLKEVIFIFESLNVFDQKQ